MKNLYLTEDIQHTSGVILIFFILIMTTSQITLKHYIYLLEQFPPFLLHLLLGVLSNLQNQIYVMLP